MSRATDYAAGTLIVSILLVLGLMMVAACMPTKTPASATLPAIGSIVGSGIVLGRIDGCTVYRFNDGGTAIYLTDRDACHIAVR